MCVASSVEGMGVAGIREGVCVAGSHQGMCVACSLEGRACGKQCRGHVCVSGTMTGMYVPGRFAVIWCFPMRICMRMFDTHHIEAASR